MDPYYRPLTIHDLVLDPTLDPSPITHSMPPKDRLLPGYAVLVTGALLGLILVLAPSVFISPSQTERAIPFPANYMDISLREDPTPGFIDGGSGGKSLYPGKGFDKDSTAHPITALSPIDFSPLEPSVIDLPSIGEKMGNLPIAIPNGDGRPLAMGQGIGNGVGGRVGGNRVGGNRAGGNRAGGNRAGGNSVGGNSLKQFDYALVPKVQVRASYQLGPGEKGDYTIVEVLVTVEEDGSVSQAKALSGPEYLYPNVIAAARKWRFEPLSIHGLTGPMRARIRFTCKII